MFALRRYALPRRLQVVLGLALMALVFAPSASGAAQLDTATATGSTDGTGGFFNISVDAHSGPSGETPGGSVSLGFYLDMHGQLVAVTVGGPVTCLKVAGNTAVIGFDDNALTGQYGVVTLVDNGGSGLDRFGAQYSANPINCSAPPAVSESALNGRAVVYDAPPLPTSKNQCKNGGWRNYQQFKNQGQCVAFVVKQARQTCLAERARIGLVAFRNKYGLGPYHVRAMRRCVNQTNR